MSDLLHSLLSEPLLLVVVAAVAVCVFAIGVTMPKLLRSDEDDVISRLSRAAARLDPIGTVDVQSVTKRAVERSLFGQVLRLLSRASAPKEEEEISRTRTRLDQAGFRGIHAVELFFGAKLFGSLMLTGGFVAVAAASHRPIPNAWMVALVLAAIGFYYPNAWLSGRIEERQKELARSLPDAFDLLVTCVEAGLGIEAAIARVVEEIGISAPLLAQEMGQMMVEIRAGLPRADAFRRLAQRTGLDDLKALAAMLIQTEMFGTSVARTLRILSDGMRIKRTQRAEERAATVATKMLIPLILCILPSLFVIIMGPAVVRIVRILVPAIGAGQ